MMLRYAAILLLSFLPLISGYGFNSGKSEGTKIETVNPSYTEAFQSYSHRLYDIIGEPSLNENVFQLALQGYYQLQKEGKLANISVLSIVDFTKSSNEKRFFLIDLINGKLLLKSLVAHGHNSGEEYATSFSNDFDSHKSSLGFFVTGETYDGDHGRSLRLDGVEDKVNDNARDRAIVVHAADYVSENFINLNRRLGRSFGCPALPAEHFNEIVEMIKNGSCMFLYYPDKNYLQTSHYVKARDAFEYFTKQVTAAF